MSLTVPIMPLMITKSPTLIGRKKISITPAATFDSVPCSARPMARPAAPMIATTLVVRTPNEFNTNRIANPTITYHRMFPKKLKSVSSSRA